MLDWKRISFFFLTVIIVLGAIGATSPRLVDRIKLGLDLKGGFEILYTAEPLTAGQPLTKETLTEAAKVLLNVLIHLALLNLRYTRKVLIVSVYVSRV